MLAMSQRICSSYRRAAYAATACTIGTIFLLQQFRLFGIKASPFTNHLAAVLTCGAVVAWYMAATRWRIFKVHVEFEGQEVYGAIDDGFVAPTEAERKLSRFNKLKSKKNPGDKGY